MSNGREGLAASRTGVPHTVHVRHDAWRISLPSPTKRKRKKETEKKKPSNHPLKLGFVVYGVCFENTGVKFIKRF